VNDYGYDDPRGLAARLKNGKNFARSPEEILKSVRSSNLQEYWKNPDDGLNNPELFLMPDGWLRSVRLFEIIRALIPPEQNPKILEIGSNVGRNLMMLWFGKYRILTGIELSERAIVMMRKTFCDSMSITVHAGEIEKLIYNLTTNSFDIIFTMAVLEHLPPQSEHVFSQIVRVMKQYLVTVEDERSLSWRHFPRRYDTVFKSFGLKQVKTIKNIDGLPRSFVCRIFRKEVMKNDE